MDNNNYNGRINISGPNIITKFSLMDKIPINPNSNYLNSLAGNLERSRLSDTFFSKQNIEAIQKGIIMGVYDRSNKEILVDKQEEEHVVTVMRSMYLQYSNNLETDIMVQVKELNKYVLAFCINNVYNEAVAYLKYKRDVSTMYTPLSAPIYSSKTNKTLEQKLFF